MHVKGEKDLILKCKIGSAPAKWGYFSPGRNVGPIKSSVFGINWEPRRRNSFISVSISLLFRASDFLLTQMVQ